MLIDWQKKHGLVADGIFGKNTAKKIAEVYNIKNPALFFGQICHESNDFKIKEENLNYSATRLLQVFPIYFNKSNVNQYANKPQLIGNKVYGGRMGNNNDNDGYYFRGRGSIQITGRTNYKSFENWLGLKNNEIMLNPDLVWKDYYVEVAIWFFDVNKLWDITDITTLTKRINGGTNGLSDRIARTNKYKSWF